MGTGPCTATSLVSPPTRTKPGDRLHVSVGPEVPWSGSRLCHEGALAPPRAPWHPTRPHGDFDRLRWPSRGWQIWEKWKRAQVGGGGFLPAAGGGYLPDVTGRLGAGAGQELGGRTGMWARELVGAVGLDVDALLWGHWVSTQGWGSAVGAAVVSGERGWAPVAHLSWARGWASRRGSARPPTGRSGGRCSLPPGQPEAEEQEGPGRGESGAWGSRVDTAERSPTSSGALSGHLLTQLGFLSFYLFLRFYLLVMSTPSVGLGPTTLRSRVSSSLLLGAPWFASLSDGALRALCLPIQQGVGRFLGCRGWGSVCAPAPAGPPVRTPGG